MIEFKPDINDNIIEYISYENSARTGKVTLSIDTPTHSMLSYIEAVNDETAEGLIRSALTAAANRNVYSCNYTAGSFIDVAVRLGFTEKNGSLYGEIPFIISGCCGCNHNKMS